MVGDYFIESSCRNGHSSSATFRGYTLEHVSEVARNLDDRCGWVCGDGEECGERIAHVVHALGPTVAPPSEKALPSSRREPPKRTTTKPSMGAVRPMPPVVIVDDAESTASTEPPPPSTEGDSRS